MSDNDKIEIFFKVLSGKDLSRKEQTAFDDFMKDNRNKELFHKLTLYKQQAIKTANKRNVNSVVDSYFKESKKFRIGRKTTLYKKFLPYASAVVIGVLMFLGVFYFSGSVITSNEISKKIAWQNDIKTDFNNAKLILADGNVKLLTSQNTNDSIIENDGTLIKKHGNALIYKKLKTNMSKKETKVNYNSLVIPKGNEYKIKLEDGTKVMINSGTRLRYPTKFSKDKRVVLLEGEAFFEVTKDYKRPFIVRTYGMDVRVFGTKFNVSSYREDKRIETTLVEGSVQVTDKNNSKIMLKPGYQAVYSSNKKKLSSRKVNVELYTAWCKGQFVFEKTSLKDIMKVLGRWYNVNIFYRNHDVSNILFTGKVKRYGDIKGILDKIEKTNDVKFTYKKNTIVVSD